jgi:hypothetical protein
VLGPLPADAQALQGHADGFAGQLPGRPALGVADLGDEVQRPHAGRLADQTRAVVQEILERLGVALFQEGPGRRRPRGFRLQAAEPFAGKGMHRIADRAHGTAEVAGDLRRPQPLGAGEQDLAAACGEGIGGAQPRLQPLPFSSGQGANEDGSFHTSLFAASCL